MTIEDWRDADPAVVRGLFAVEETRWRTSLRWETDASWRILEEGRLQGHVPGWILRSRTGEVQGWTYYLLHDGELQIGGMVASRATVMRTLLDRVLDSPEASLASSVSALVFPASTSLLSALSRRRFAVRRSLYLSKPLAADRGPLAVPGGLRLRTFAEHDLFPAARLLAAAYAGTTGAECFAPHGRLDEWARYLRQMMETPACGQWRADASLVADEPGRPGLLGLVLTTGLSAGTAHIAQIAVDRSVRGMGLGEALMAHASARARETGDDCMTLMVDEGNAAARRLYARDGFTECSSFVYARRRGQIRTADVLDQTRRLAG
jgi:ribosomal protein S18 acetylase RimI-like enzyme